MTRKVIFMDQEQNNNIEETLDSNLNDMAIELKEASKLIKDIASNTELSDEEKLEQSIEHLLKPVAMLYDRFGIIPVANPDEIEEKSLIINPFDQNNLFVE